MSTIDRYVEAVGRQDWAAVADLLHDDYVGEFPQSGEIIRGPDGYRAVYSNYSGGLPETTDLTPVGETRPEVEIVQPVNLALPIITLAGGGDEFTVIGRAKYTNGQSGFLVGFIKTAENKIIKETIYFAEDFDPPEWRKGLTELRER